MMIGVSVGAKFVKNYSGDCYYSTAVTNLSGNDKCDATAKIATTGYGPFRTVALVKNMIVENKSHT
jgi:hypothetical protein